MRQAKVVACACRSKLNTVTDWERSWKVRGRAAVQFGDAKKLRSESFLPSAHEQSLETRVGRRRLFRKVTRARSPLGGAETSGRWVCWADYECSGDFATADEIWGEQCSRTQILSGAGSRSQTSSRNDLEIRVTGQSSGRSCYDDPPGGCAPRNHGGHIRV